MQILLKNRSDVPIYEQVEAQLREQILSGVLAEGTPAEIRGHPDVIAAYLGTSQETRGS